MSRAVQQWQHSGQHADHFNKHTKRISLVVSPALCSSSWKSVNTEQPAVPGAHPVCKSETRSHSDCIPRSTSLQRYCVLLLHKWMLSWIERAQRTYLTDAGHVHHLPLALPSSTAAPFSCIAP